MRKSLTHEVSPTHYDLFVNVEEGFFNGTVVMHLHPQYPLSTFKFNSKNLDLSSLSVKEGKRTIEASFEEKEEFVTVNLKEEVSRDFTLSVDYKGEYSSSMEGFYKSLYNENVLYSTHFEPTDARQAFPCFDQPDMKSTFSISIQVPEGNIALSNNSLKEKKGHLFIFEKTPIMSTYIVAYVIGVLDYVEDNTFIPIRVYADPNEKQWGDFALQVATRCLKFFESYFEVAYPLPKLDMVAIPSFAMGAMENWGLVTYRKTSLHFDETSTSMRSKKNIAITVCHELAHMWFGNLVTMRWWSDLWLNEGFATWAATLAISKALHDILPWDAWSSFINDEIESGMGMDCLRSTHSIAIEVNDPVEIDQIFDAISYSKGSSVIKMLENWLGPDIFRTGLVSYIKKHSYSNAETKDLWASLTEVANRSLRKENILEESIDVARVIDPWVKRDGFPYLIVDDLGSKLKLTQKRFTIGFEKNDQPWPIPIRILWIDGDSRKSSVFVMYGETMEIEKESPLYKFNDDVSGFYRVLYPQSIPERLITNGLSVNNRMNLFSDQFAMAKALKAPLSSALSLSSHLDSENNYEILLNVISDIKFARSVFYNDEEKRNYFNKKLSEIVEPKISSIDISKFPTDINEVSASSLIVATAVDISHSKTIDTFKSVDLKKMNPEYARACFSALVDENGEFEHLIDIYKVSTKPGEKQNALFSLGTTKIEKNIDYLFDNLEFVEPHDSIYMFASLASNLLFRNKIARLYIDNFTRIKRHVNNANLIRHSLEYVLQKVIQDGEKENVLAFLYSLKDDKEMKSAVDKCYDSLTIATAFRDTYKGFEFQ